MKNNFYSKKMWVLLLASIVLGASAYATQIPIPSTPADSLEHFLEQHTDLYANGDTILLIDASYVVSGTADLYHGVTIMGDPGLSERPMVQFLDNGFRLKQDSTSVIIKGLNLNGYNDDMSHRAKFILRMDNLPASDSIFYNMKIVDVYAVGFGGGIDLHQQKHAQYDSIIVDNVIWHDFSGEYCVDPNINFSGHVSITNSTFYDITHGFVKNPDFASDKNNFTKIDKEFVIDHNTIYNLGGSNNALIQINDPKDSTVTLTFTNNIVQKLYDPTNVRPFRINESAGTFTFDYNVFFDFMPTEETKMQYSLDSTVKNQTNVTSTNEINTDPQLLDVGDFRLPLGSPLFTADSDGNQIGDPRWGVFEGVYIYEPEDKVYTNAPVQLKASIVEVGGATDLTWSLEQYYGSSFGEATVDATGLLSPTNAGQVKVIATSDATAVFDTLIVTIQDSIHVTGLQLNAETTVIVEDDGDLDITASLTPNNPTDQRVEWSVSDERFAKINKVTNDTVMELVAKSSGVVDVIAKSLDNPAVADTIEITISIPGLVAHWKLDETAGTTAADEKYHSDGELINGEDASWVEGLDSNAIDLSKSDTTCIVVPSNSYNDFDSTVSFTLSALIKVDDFGSNREILFKGYTSTDAAVPGSKGNWIAMALNTTQIRFFIDDNTTKTNLDFSGADRYMHEGDWNHLVCVRDLTQDSLFIFINGVKMASLEDLTDLDISSGPLPWVIGGGGKQNTHFDGLLDDIMLYNIALSEAEIAQMTADYGITAIVPLNNDATLSDLQVDGTTLPDFASGKIAYEVELDAGTTVVPTLTATTTDENASAVVTPATALPGTSTVLVTAEDGKATKTYSVAFTVAVDNLGDVNYSEIGVYPNPANDFITITIPQQALVKIHNVAGNLVMEELLEVGETIDIQELDSGVYFIHVSMGDQVSTLRFVKN